MSTAKRRRDDLPTRWPQIKRFLEPGGQYILLIPWTATTVGGRTSLGHVVENYVQIEMPCYAD